MIVNRRSSIIKKIKKIFVKRQNYRPDVPVTTKNKLYYVDKSLIDYAKKYIEEKEEKKEKNDGLSSQL